MPRYIAIQPIEHAGGRAEPGATIELSEEHAAQALALGHIAPAGKTRRAAEPSQPAPEASPAAPAAASGASLDPAVASGAESNGTAGPAD